jgi:TP901 family phage tail tape measure protein
MATGSKKQGEVNLRIGLEGAAESTKAVGRLRAELEQVAAKIGEINAKNLKVDQLSNRLLKKGGLPEGGDLKALLGILKGGGAENRLLNAVTKFKVDSFTAQIEQDFAKVTNVMVKGLKDLVKAANDQAAISFNKLGTTDPKSLGFDRKTLLNQKLATEARIANFSVDGRSNPQEQAKFEAYLEMIKTRLLVIDSLEKRRVSNQNELERAQRKLATLEATGEEKQRSATELQVQRLIVARERIRMESGQTSEYEKQLAILKEMVSKREQDARLAKESARNTVDSRRAEKAFTKQTQNAEATALRIQTLEASGQKIGSLSLQIKEQQKIVDREQLKINSGQTNEYEKQLGILKQLYEYKRKEAEAAKTKAAALTAEEVVARKIAINKAALANPDAIRSQTALNNAQTRDRVTGDGGAALFTIQAALLKNYLVMNQLFSVVQFGTDFVLQLDKAFFQLQAITGTTNTEMAGLRTQIIEVSEATKFTAVQVAEAATILGQAGFSVSQIKESIKAVTLFATATGSDLNQAVDIVTSTLSVFNLTASETGQVANTLTTAINDSKLTVEKLTLGLQYAGQIAAQSGATFEELSSVLGAFANSGVRSGSTLGTNLRQLLSEFAQPSEKLTSVMRALGLGMTDINVKSNGLITVFETLKRAGFGSAEAFEALDIRAAQAYISIAANVDLARALEQQFLFSNAAIEANAVQTQSLSNSLDRFKSVLGTVIANASGPFVSAFKKMVDILGGVLSAFNKFPDLLSGIGTALVALASGAIVASLGSLAAGLFTVEKGAKAAALATRALAFAMGPTGITAVLIAAAVAWSLITDKTKSAKDVIDKLRGAVDEATGRFEKYEERTNSLQAAVDNLLNRQAALTEDATLLKLEVGRLNQQFGNWGLTLDNSTSSVEAMVQALRDLQTSMQQIQLAELQVEAFARDKLIDQLGKTYAEAAKRGAAVFTESVSAVSGAKIGQVAARTTTEGALAQSLFTNGTSGLGLNSNGQEFNSRNADMDQLLSQVNTIRSRIASVDAFLNTLERSPAEALKLLPESIRNIGRADLIASADTLKSTLNTQLGAVSAIAEQLAARQQDVIKFDSLEFDNRNKDLLQQNDSLKLAFEQVRTAIDKGAEDAKGIFQQLDLDEKEALLAGLKAKADEVRAEMEKRKDDKGYGGSQAIIAPMQRLLGDVTVYAKSAMSVVQEGIKDQRDFNIARLEAEVRAIQTSTTKFTPISDVYRNMDAAVKAFNDQRELERDNEEKKLRKNLSLAQISNGDLERGLKIFDQETANSRETLKDSFTRFVDSTVDTFDDVKTSYGTIVDDLKTFTTEFKAQLDAIMEPLEARKRQSSLMTGAGFSDKFSKLQNDVFNRETELLEPQFITRQLRFYSDKAEELRSGIVQRAQSALEKVNSDLSLLQTRQIKLQDDVKNKRGGAQSENEAKELAQEINRLSNEKTRLLNEEAGARAELLKATEGQLAAEQRLADIARLQQTNPLTLKQGFGAALEQYTRSIGGFKSVTSNLNDEFIPLFDAMNSSFQNFVKNIVTGSGSALDAVKGLAAGIVEAALQIAVNQIAVQLFSSAFGAFSGGSGFSSNQIASSPGLSGSFGSFNNGGFIRAARGRYVPNRDSVPALLEPGEFVMRKSAVDGLGRENLEQLNALGNRTMSQSEGLRGALPSGPSTPPAPVNVWVVQKDNVPPPSSRDIIALVNDDILRGGQTKKLIRAVQQGAV